MGKKIMVTGGAGFIGSQLTNKLAKCGTKVYVVDNLYHSTAHYIVEPSVELIEADLSDTDCYAGLLNEVDTVVHLAAAGNVIQSIEDPILNYKNNVLCTISLLEEVRLSNCNKIIFSSTGGALMGNTAPPISENSVPNPISPYGASKLACEAYLRAYAASYNLAFTIFRFGNVIGPNCAHKAGVVQKYFHSIKNNLDLEVYGDVSRDFIFSGDLVNIMDDCLRVRLPQNETFLLASGKETKIFDLARKILVQFPASHSKIIKKSGRIGEVGKNYADISKFRSLYPSYQFIGLNEALQTALDYLIDAE